MKTFDITQANRQQRTAFKNLHTLLAGKYDHRGPFQTSHGWPYFLIDTPTQTLSIRSTKAGGKRIYVVYERFGEMDNRQPSHHCNRDNVGDTIDSILMRDIDNWPPNWL